MADTAYIKEMIIMEKGKPTKLVPILVSKDENKTLARAYLTGSPHQTINDNTYTKVLLDTESWDIGSNFAAYKFVAPAPGKYQVNFAALLYDAGGSLNTAHSGLYVNGAEVLRGAMYLGPDISYFGSPGGGSINMAKNDYAELWALGNTTDDSTLIVHAGSALTYMDIYLIST